MSLRVLLIHADESHGAQSKASLLSAEPEMQVATAQSLHEVKSHPVPEVILLDLNSSLEVLEWLRSEGPYLGVPVIALGSSATLDCVDRAYQLGANACVMTNDDGALREDIARGIGTYVKVLSSSRTPGAEL